MGQGWPHAVPAGLWGWFDSFQILKVHVSAGSGSLAVLNHHKT